MIYMRRTEGQRVGCPHEAGKENEGGGGSGVGRESWKKGEGEGAGGRERGKEGQRTRCPVARAGGGTKERALLLN